MTTPSSAASSGLIQRYVLDQHLNVVHPRVVRLQRTTTDQAETAVTRPLNDAGLQASEFLKEWIGEEIDPLLRGLAPRQPRFERAEIDAVRVVAQLLQAETVGIRAEGIAVRTGAQHRIEHAIAGVAVDHGDEVWMFRPSTGGARAPTSAESR